MFGLWNSKPRVVLGTQEKHRLFFFFAPLHIFIHFERLIWTFMTSQKKEKEKRKALDIHAMPSFFILILGADILSLAHLSYGFDLCIIMMTIMMHWCASCLLVCHAQIKGKVRSWVSPWKSFSTFSASLTPF